MQRRVKVNAHKGGKGEKRLRYGKGFFTMFEFVYYLSYKKRAHNFLDLNITTYFIF